jgi:hypothetical protein
MENHWVVLAYAGLALMGMLGIAWRFRARAARRWRRVLESYAQQEISQELYRKGPKRRQRFAVRQP